MWANRNESLIITIWVKIYQILIQSPFLYFFRSNEYFGAETKKYRRMKNEKIDKPE